MSIYLALSKIPFKDIATTAALIVATAGKLYDTIKKHKVKQKSSSGKDDATPPIDDLRDRVQQLESENVEQAKIIAELAGQTETLSNGISVLGARITASIIISGIAILIAVLHLFWNLL